MEKIIDKGDKVFIKPNFVSFPWAQHNNCFMAADASAARIMSHKVPSIRQLTIGHDMKLGEIDENTIEFLGEKLENMIMPWKPARMKN